MPRVSSVTHCTRLLTPSVSSSPATARPYTVLIVDDEPGIREFLRAALETEGYAVVDAANGAEALASVRASAPDVILTDLLMPIMDGRTFATIYRMDPGPHAPIIAMSASSKVLGPYAKLPEVFAYFDKPFELQELFDAIENAIGEYRSEADGSDDSAGA